MREMVGRQGNEIMPHYRVLKHGESLGTLTITDGDFPWLLGNFVPAPAFEAVRPMFDRVRERLDAGLDAEPWEDVWEELAVGLVLEPTDGGKPITEFLLHIRGSSAEWRY